MNNPGESLKPLRTWSHLAEKRRRPSEYEIVSANLHYRSNFVDKPWGFDRKIPMNEWYRNYCYGSPLKHGNWDSFRDPDEVVYRTYILIQDGQESYVKSLLDQFGKREHDKGLEREWVNKLSKVYTPVRYPYHALQMGSAYIAQMAPSSTITNAASFQAGDSLRWLTHTAYRTRELANEYPEIGFGENERGIWERDPIWQGYRELVEKALVTWDWGEAFVAINIVTKPAIEEVLLEGLGVAARANGDTLYGLISQSHLRDAERHRRWAGALVELALSGEGNRDVIRGWVEKWMPLARNAIDGYCEGIPDGGVLAEEAKERVDRFHLGLKLI